MIPYDLIIPSASRPHLLDAVLRTLFLHLDQHPQRVLIHDDAVFPNRVERGYILNGRFWPGLRQVIRERVPSSIPVVLLCDNAPIFHGPALQRLLAEVKTEYVLYSQDDHCAVRDIPVAQALACLDWNVLNQIRFNKRDTMDKKGREGEEFYKVEKRFSQPSWRAEVPETVTCCVADHWYFQTGVWRVSAIKPVVDWWAGPGRAHGAFTEHCLVGTTVIDTPRGPISIQDLAAGLRGPRVHIYAYDIKRAQFVVAEAHGFRKTQETAVVWKLTCQDGTYLLATPDHKILLKSGKYKRLAALCPGDSLMPLYRGYSSIVVAQGHEIAEHRFVAGEIYGPSAIKGRDINHRDGNRSNNDPSNLEPLMRGEHARKLRPEFRKKAVAAMHQANRLMWADLTRRGELTAALRKRTGSSKVRRKMSRSGKARWRAFKADPAVWLAYQEMCRQRKTAWWASRKAIAATRPRRTDGRFLPGRFAENHTVQTVEPWGVADVYNMEVPTHHNFVANGLVVHNCEVKINQVFNGEWRGKHPPFPIEVPVLRGEGAWNDPEVRGKVHKTFIWGPVGEPAYVKHLGTDPKDWALIRGNRDQPGTKT